MASARYAHLIDAIAQLRADALDQERKLLTDLSLLHPEHRAAGRNLAHYLAIRQHDIRELQRELAALGLSSLGRMEKCVLATLAAVEHALACLAHQAEERPPSDEPPTNFETADEALREKTSALLGDPPRGRAARIMLTLPSDTSAGALDELLREGADVVRINCAKGDVSEWTRLVEGVRLAAARRGSSCRILCDLAGPNPRTLKLDRARDDDVIGRAAPGDLLVLAKKSEHGGARLAFGCTLPSILDDLRPGERIFYDDGKLAGVVRDVTEARATIEVTFARKERVKLRAGKGLNFPDSRLNLPSLTPKDLADLEFVAQNADLVGMSFVRDPEDIRALQLELARLGKGELGLVLKIETTRAFEVLPRLLLTALRSHRVGVMVARGDMAMEMGFERLAEAQEEILWVSEAAFVPVIWATQVLDTLNKTGIPSRAEVTDAAMGSRAECVMLNQGKHVIETLRFLRHVLERMQDHQEKKRSMLRKLRISRVS